MVRFVTFDATGTLFHSPRMGAIYSEVLDRHGIEVTPAQASKLAHEVWAEMDCSASIDVDRFAEHPERARGWWRRFLERFCERLEVAPASRFASAELYDRFSKAEAWEVFREVSAVLSELSGQGLTLGVLSNWDERLPRLLADLDLADHFAQVVYSGEVGFEKPHPGIFESALARLQCEPSEVVHVGDSRRRDVEGAQAIGMSTLYLNRSGRGEVKTLAELPSRIEKMNLVGEGVAR